VAAGFDRVFLTILDTHIASLIAAAFLFQFGTGPIRGFATTLTLGLLANVFTAVMVSRTLFEVALSRAAGKELKLWTIARTAGRRSFDFLSCRWYALAFSAAVVAACLPHHRARRHSAWPRLHWRTPSSPDSRRRCPRTRGARYLEMRPFSVRAGGRPRPLIRLPQTPDGAARIDPRSKPA
jgi:hypothetical protein